VGASTLPLMLHMRLITPSSRTDEVASLLEKTVGTAHLVVLPGAARDPKGDVVMCDVAREAADELIRDLRALGLDEHGAISMEDIDLSLSKRGEQAEEDAPGEGVDAVLWESLTDATHEESRLTVTYLAFLIVATMIAACGVMLDSAILIVGAMAVGPEFGPLAGVCTALVRGAPRLALRPLLALVVGFPVAMLATGLFTVCMDAAGLFTRKMYEQPHPVSEFVWQPDMTSFVVAALAGVAGMLSLTSAKSGALVGVAISVTTVPAAADAAMALSYGDPEATYGSAQQLGLNLLGILVAGTLTLLGQKTFWAWKRRHLARAGGPAGAQTGSGS
jgi:uncharacterized hydrophobic protein (TIGR00271 family)